MPDTSPDRRRIVLTLRKPPIGWFPKPTVVFEGRGHPAQWGSGTWQVASEEPSEIGVYLFNRLWRFGDASIVIQPDGPSHLLYRAPLLPFARGRLRAVGQ